MRPVAFLLFIVLISSCTRQRTAHVIPSFYYWSANYNITTTDSVFLHETACQKMYVRFFDVGMSDSWDSPVEIIPKGRLRNTKPFSNQVKTVPVVYIENEVFKGNQSPEDLRWLSSKITTKLFRMARNNGLPEESIEEVQLDCDWTDKTRENYFGFLKVFKEQCGNKKLSVTLRLYQYKYRTRSGVPPVDRCMLMYYNMSNVKEPSTKNYILDNNTGKKYIKDIKPYPLPLDMALPIYSQGVHYNSSDSSFYALRQMYIKDTSGKNITRPNLANGHLFLTEKGDNYSFIRFEFVSPAMLHEASEILSEAVNTDTFSVSFFHLDQELYKNIGNETFGKVVDRFGNSR